MASDESQIDIPPSFMALYTAPGGHKLTLPRAELAQRYELCEDLAQMLTDTARNIEFQLGITEADVLQRCLQGLLPQPAEPDAPAVVSGPEARWVITRLAELLGWSALP